MCQNGAIILESGLGNAQLSGTANGGCRANGQQVVAGREDPVCGAVTHDDFTVTTDGLCAGEEHIGEAACRIEIPGAVKGESVFEGIALPVVVGHYAVDGGTVKGGTSGHHTAPQRVVISATIECATGQLQA